MNRLIAIAGAFAVTLATGSAQAAYPERPIKLIVPWAAGGDTDVVYRTLQPLFQKAIGGTLVVANVGGASGTKGARKRKARRPTVTRSSRCTTPSTRLTTPASRT